MKVWLLPGQIHLDLSFKKMDSFPCSPHHPSPNTQHHGTLLQCVHQTGMPWMPWLQKQYTQPTVNIQITVSFLRGSRSACSTFPVLAWFGPPTHAYRIPLVVLQALVLVLPGWNHRMLPPCPMSRCPRLNPLPSASLDPSVERFQALGNVRPRDENLWQTLKNHWPLGVLGHNLDNIFWQSFRCSSHHDIISAPKLEWMMTPRIQDTQTPQSRSCCKNQVLNHYKTTARLFGTQSMTFQKLSLSLKCWMFPTHSSLLVPTHKSHHPQAKRGTTSPKCSKCSCWV